MRNATTGLLDDATTDTDRLLVALAALLAGAVAATLAGGSPDLFVALVLLGVAAVHPILGLGYTMVVAAAPLGLWLLGVEEYTGAIFGDRPYVLSLSSAAVVIALLVGVVARRPPPLPRRLWTVGPAAGLGLLSWTLVGFAHHGVPQTLVGLRLLLVPLAVLVVVWSLDLAGLRTLVGLLAWLVIANAVAAVGESVAGPGRLVAWGFEDERAVRYIDGTFRAPGLTEFNAELGMLAGTYLLGYAALWLTGGAGGAGGAGGGRPRPVLWHAGAGAAALCLALSTSRSGALLLVGGVLGAVVLDRSGGPTRRRVARLLGLAVVAAVALGFAVLGATGARSLVERADVWSALLRDVPVFGSGPGSAGAATFSRVAAGPHVFVDNYFVTTAVQFGPVVAVALAGLIAVALIRLARRSAGDPAGTVHLAVLSGLACSFLVIDAWEYAAAMTCLAVFAGYARRLRRPGPG